MGKYEIDIKFQSDHPHYSFGRLSLIDITINQAMLHKEYYPDEVGTNEFRVDPTHEYKLTLVGAAASADDSLSMRIIAEISVPEFATMLLLAAGFIGIAELERRNRKIKKK